MPKKQQLSYEDIQTQIKQHRRAYSKGEKMAWGDLKRSLSVAWSHGYITYPGGIESFHAGTTAGREVLIELAEQFYNGKLVTKSTLNDRGWTAGLLKKWGLTPDLYVKNPHYKRAGDMALYSLNRVTRVEKDDDVATDLTRILEKRPARQEAALQAADTRLKRDRGALEKEKEEFQIFLDGLDLNVPEWSVSELLSRTVKHYNDFHYGRNCTIGDDPNFLARIVYNYLRHDCTNYDQLIRLYPDSWKYDQIRARVDEAFSAKYSDLVAQIGEWQLEESMRLQC